MKERTCILRKVVFRNLNKGALLLLEELHFGPFPQMQVMPSDVQHLAKTSNISKLSTCQRNFWLICNQMVVLTIGKFNMYLPLPSIVTHVKGGVATNWVAQSCWSFCKCRRIDKKCLFAQAYPITPIRRKFLLLCTIAYSLISSFLGPFHFPFFFPL